MGEVVQPVLGQAGCGEGWGPMGPLACRSKAIPRYPGSPPARGVETGGSQWVGVERTPGFFAYYGRGQGLMGCSRGYSLDSWVPILGLIAGWGGEVKAGRGSPDAWVLSQQQGRGVSRVRSPDTWVPARHYCRRGVRGGDQPAAPARGAAVPEGRQARAAGEAPGYECSGGAGAGAGGTGQQRLPHGGETHPMAPLSLPGPACPSHAITGGPKSPHPGAPPTTPYPACPSHATTGGPKSPHPSAPPTTPNPTAQCPQGLP